MPFVGDQSQVPELDSAACDNYSCHNDSNLLLLYWHNAAGDPVAGGVACMVLTLLTSSDVELVQISDSLQHHWPLKLSSTGIETT